ncbi:MAG: UvrD-helicase domain-containing protein, partial [Ruminococcus sp.]|nr:UvrD-helicase domain-containing protein [Ruminococcus sp.]
IEKDENGRICQSEIAKRIADLYDVIMIDEYQDSNNKQDLIFKLISKNFKYDSDGNSMYGDNVFLVGDIKQSIYGFRLANPQNFKDVMQKSKPYSDNEKSKNQSIFLNENFRSSEETIDFINFIFKEIMTEKCGGIDYSQKDEQLHFGAKKYNKSKTESRVTDIMLINTDSLEKDENDDNEAEVIESPEAEIIADKIAQMITDKVQVVKDDEGETRDCEASDFCILLRKKAFMNTYVKALQKRGISAKGDEEQGYLKSQEVAILIDLLRVIANPLQDVPLTVVMFSPMYMFSLEEIAYIKTKAIDKKDQKIDRKKLMYQVIIEAVNGEIEDFDPQLAEKCRKFVRSLENFRFDSVTMTIGELITSIYDNTDFMSVMQLYKDGEKKRANLRMLIKYAQDYEKFASADGRGGLSGFLRHIDRVSDESDYNQGKVPVFSRDYVTVQTLHKSKGLQYPFVFICETSSKFRFDNDSVMCSDDCRIGFILHNKNFVRKYRTFQHTLLKGEKSEDTRSEEMRLLYVGMTRAEQKLFVTLKCGQKSKEKLLELVENCVINDSNINNLVAEANSFSDWLWLCLMMHGEFPAIADCIGLDSENSCFPAHDESKKLFDIEYFDKIPCISESDEEKKMPEADSELTEQIKSIMESEYDFTLSETPEKLTVTQILEKLDGKDSKFNSSLERPAFMTEKGATGSERGTAIHTFFQYCSFELAEKDADAEITRLNNNGFLTKVQTEIVRENISKIDAFFRSDLYIRIKSAVESGRCEREKKFLVKFSDLQKKNTVFENIINSDSMIKGVVDLIYEEDDGLVVVDYKSDKVHSADTLIKSYSNQLEFYKLAVELITGKKVKALVIYSVELEKAIAL